MTGSSSPAPLDPGSWVTLLASGVRRLDRVSPDGWAGAMAVSPGEYLEYDRSRHPVVSWLIPVLQVEVLADALERLDQIADLIGWDDVVTALREAIAILLDQGRVERDRHGHLLVPTTAPGRGELMTPEVQLLVPTGDLLQALKAVTPFGLADIDSLDRVRLTAEDHVTYVQAADGYSAALALVSTSALSRPVGHEGSVEFDLTLDQARLIPAVFKLPKDKDEAMQAELRFDVTSEHVTVVDAGGMIDGQELILPRAPTTAAAPRVLRLLATRIHSAPAPHRDHPPVLPAGHLSLLVAAARVYKSDVTLEHIAPTKKGVRGTVLARVGESFLAQVVDVVLADAVAAERGEWAQRWRTRLKDVPRLTVDEVATR